MGITNVYDVVSWRLCVGCGACHFFCPRDNIKLVDIETDGIRPVLKDSSLCKSCQECLKTCPGLLMAKTSTGPSSPLPKEFKKWGSYLELLEGYATDEELRFTGASGGIVTALALYCIEKAGFRGVVHIGADKKKPWKNVTKFSTKREELLENTGSRYSPASACEGLKWIEDSDRPCVFVGKPCEIIGTKMVEGFRPYLAKNIGLNIGIFCAGTPSTQGLLDIFKIYNIDPNNIEKLRFRGKGWPGRMSIKLKGEKEPGFQLPYEKSWGFLQAYRPFRCYICPDGTGELADISCGDAWYKKNEDEKGLSLILVRTERGKKILHEAVEAGYLQIKTVPDNVLEESQINQLNKKRAIWGRLLSMKMFGIPVPKYQGYYLFENWLDLPFKEKVISILGTVKRLILRRYYRPKNY